MTFPRINYAFVSHSTKYCTILIEGKNKIPIGNVGCQDAALAQLVHFIFTPDGGVGYSKGSA